MMDKSKPSLEAPRHVLLTDLNYCRELQWGRVLHAGAIGRWNDSETYLANVFINMYRKCSYMVGAREVFDNMQNPDVVAWTNMIMGYAENGDSYIAVGLLSKMRSSGCAPDSVTYVALLKACTALAGAGDDSQKQKCLKLGKEIHSEIGSHLDYRVQHMLLDMYCKCGSIINARWVFDSIENPSVVSWTALIWGYAHNNEGHMALDMFSKMKVAGCKPNSVTYIAALKACISLAVNADKAAKRYFLRHGKAIHSEVGHHMNHFVQSTLIDMYSKCGSMVDASSVFESIQTPDLISWTAMLLGYVENGEGVAALEFLLRMKARRGCTLDSVTYVAALKACGLVGALALGRKFHSEITEFTPQIVTCLVDFYAKCGSVIEAREVFEFHRSSRCVTTWTALLAGFSRFGDYSSVFHIFKAMQDEGIRPNSVTFVCLLLCCRNAGLVERAKQYFEEMPVKYQVVPTIVHYTCMVGVLGHENRLNEAMQMIREMPYSADAVTWTTLLGACRKWKNVELGREAFEALEDLDERNSAAYVLMSHIFGLG